MKIKAGMSIVVVMRDKRRDDAVKTGTVQSVGRKWAYLHDGDRFDIHTLCIDGGPGYSSKGVVYPTMEDYNYEIARNKQLRNLRNLVGRTINPSVTLPDIEQAIQLLGGDKNNEI